MLERLHVLLAEENYSPEAPEIAEVEDAYATFCTTSPGPASPGYGPRPPASSSPSGGQRSAGCVWLAVGVGLLIVAAVVVAFIIAAQNNSGGKAAPATSAAAGGSSAQPSSPSNTRPASPSSTRPALDPGVTGEVGSCWRESSRGSNQYREVDCGSSLAEVRVYSEQRDPSKCGARAYFDIGGGWYLCLLDL